jgi:hypothetical protein
MSAPHPCSVVLLLAAAAAGCFPSEEEVQRKFRDYVDGANHCQRADECALASADCPLGCYVPVRADRKADVEARARELVDAYRRGGTTCAYGCVQPGPLECRNDRCIMLPFGAPPDAGPKVVP